MLRYDKGELIMKEGDYGISVYRINRGKVSIFKESEGKKIILDVLGPGDVFGETAFLHRGKKIRISSVRAIEDLELEAYHPSILAEEFGKLPYIIRYLANETLGSLVRMNNRLTRLIIAQKQKIKSEEKAGVPWESKRKFYRKAVKLPCVYRPTPSPQYVNLEGYIADISRGGLRMNARIENAENFTHNIGSQFIINTALPNSKELELPAKIVSLTKDSSGKRLVIGMEFTDLPQESQRHLGFFLMP
ncbi:MAG: cyclic nucleotide-binding domain-containing protein [Deltaproteobacteria bacterium]|nr:cyclic nucleotide-binding domain-containing protein [Deltaproteobacteria bacterium]